MDSEPDAGSTFWFTARFEKGAPDESADAPPRPILEGRRALVVDDNATNREILSRQLSAWGLGTGTAESAARGFESLRNAARKGEPYDLALIDMRMPGMNGREMARVIKADPALSSTGLILLTSEDALGENGGTERSGFSVVLTKPLRQSRLHDAVVRVLGLSADVEPGPEGASARRESDERGRAGSGARVLVAEDNAVNQRVATRMLESMDYRADVVANGIEAVEAVSRVPYAAVLMDVQMPEMDGHAATAEIRRREEGTNAHVPIIAITADAMEGDRERALASGMDDYLAKPVRQEDLSEVLARWVQRETPENGHAGATVPDDDGPLDRGLLDGLRKLGDKELLPELIGLFFEDVPGRLERLRAAIEAGDAQAVGRDAHALKGSCGSLGALRMSEIAAELQDAGASGDLSAAPGMLDRLEEEYARVRPELAAEAAPDIG